MKSNRSNLLLFSISLVVLLGIFIYAFGQSNNSPQITPDAKNQKSEQPQPDTSKDDSKPTNIYDVRINFSKNPESYSDFTYTQSVNRKTERIDMGTFAIEQLIAGPTSEESANGLFSPLQNKFSGDSNCSGADFSLVVSATGKATVKFCRDLITAGVGEDAMISETITKTLKQFSAVYKVVILDKNGNCFGDLSGENQCLK